MHPGLQLRQRLGPRYRLNLPTPELVCVLDHLDHGEVEICGGTQAARQISLARTMLPNAKVVRVINNCHPVMGEKESNDGSHHRDG